jgi:FkbM family methyltransferase
MSMYKESDKVKFMKNNLEDNVKILSEFLNLESQNKKIENKPMLELDSLFFRKKLFNISFDSNDNKITFDYLEGVPFSTIVCVRDIDTEIPIYSFEAFFSERTSVWCVPIPKAHYDFQGNPNFGGFLFDFYDLVNSDKKVYSMSIRLKRTAFQKAKFRVESFDPLFVNYEQFFTDKIYENFFNQIDKLETVVDVGANVGLFTELCLQRGSGKVFALEINEKAINTFENVHSKNNQVKLIKEGLSSQEGEIEIFTDPENSLVSSIYSTHTAGLSQKSKIKVIGLSDLLKRESIEKIDLIKIDVEGAEYDIFRGVSIEDLSKINYILMEFHDNFGNILREDILNKLESAGFEYKIYQDDCIGEAYEYEERGTIFAVKK